MLERARLAWRLLSLYEEVKGMGLNAIIRLGVSFLTGLVAVAGACYLAGDHASIGHCLVAGGTAGVTTAFGYLKTSPLSESGPEPRS